MPKLPPDRLPSDRLHKQSGQAMVTLDGHDLCLGKFDSPESRQKYDQVIAEWIANGRRLPARASELTVIELINAYWRHAESYYRVASG